MQSTPRKDGLVTVSPIPIEVNKTTSFEKVSCVTQACAAVHVISRPKSRLHGKASAHVVGFASAVIEVRNNMGGLEVLPCGPFNAIVSGIVDGGTQRTSRILLAKGGFIETHVRGPLLAFPIIPNGSTATRVVGYKSAVRHACVRATRVIRPKSGAGYTRKARFLSFIQETWETSGSP